jgi:predicted nucleotidyltransferase
MKQVTDNILSEITERIRKAVNPEKIILFGSWAWGTPGASSDLDLFVVVPHSTEPSYRRSRVIYRCLRGVGIPIDVIVQTRDEVERGKRVTTSLTHTVLEKGRVLYG